MIGEPKLQAGADTSDKDQYGVNAGRLAEINSKSIGDVSDDELEAMLAERKALKSAQESVHEEANKMNKSFDEIKVAEDVAKENARIAEEDMRRANEEARRLAEVRAELSGFDAKVISDESLTPKQQEITASREEYTKRAASKAASLGGDATAEGVLQEQAIQTDARFDDLTSWRKKAAELREMTPDQRELTERRANYAKSKQQQAIGLNNIPNARGGFTAENLTEMDAYEENRLRGVVNRNRVADRAVASVESGDDSAEQAQSELPANENEGTRESLFMGLPLHHNGDETYVNLWESRGNKGVLNDVIADIITEGRGLIKGVMIKAKIQRTSGEIDKDWKILGFDGNTSEFIMFKEKVGRKRVSLRELTDQNL